MAQAAPEPVTAAVLPFSGPKASALTEGLIASLRKTPSVEVIDLRALGALSAELAGRVSKCSSNDCRVKTLQSLPWDELIVGQVSKDGVNAQALLQDGSVRIHVTVEAQVSSEALAERVVKALYSDRLQNRPVSLTVSGLPRGAAIRWGDRAPERAEASAWRTEAYPGAYAVEVRAPGHEPWLGTVAVEADSTELALGLKKRRSDVPYWLGGAGLAAAAGGAALWAVSEARASEWASACQSGICSPGFTLERYRSDQDALDREQIAGGVLISVGSAALISAVVWFLADNGQPGPNQSFE